jgi:hypothetical protein
MDPKNPREAIPAAAKALGVVSPGSLLITTAQGREASGLQRIHDMPRKPDGSFLQRFGQEWELGIPGLRPRVGMDRDKIRKQSVDKAVTDFRALRQDVGPKKYDSIINPSFDALANGDDDKAFNSLPQAQRDRWNGLLDQLEKDVASGKLKPTDAETVAKDAMLSDFQLTFQKMNVKKAIEAFKTFTPAQQQELKPLLEKKGNSINELYEDEQPAVRAEFEKLTGRPARDRAPREKTFRAMKYAVRPSAPLE